MRVLLFIAAFFATFSTANAQLVTSLNSPASQTDLSAIQAQIPQPSSTVGNAEMVGGSVGTATTYKRGDWVPPRISRTGSCTLNASGVCTATWQASGSASPFPAGVTPVMLGDPSAVNSSATFPINCNVTGLPTLTGVSVKCWVGQNTIVGALGATVAPWLLLSGVTVTVAAFPGT